MADLIYAGDGGAFKICGTCKDVKTLGEFARRKSALDGMRNVCKDCENSPRRDGPSVGATIQCEGCGTAMTKTGTVHKFCDGCSRARNIEKSLVVYRSKRGERGVRAIGETAYRCMDCGSSVVYTGGHNKRCVSCQEFFRNNRHFLENWKEPAHESIGVCVPCAECGVSFPKKASNNRYCSPGCYRIADAIRRRARHARHQEKRRLDPHNIISSRVSSSMRSALKRGKDGYHWEDILGYDRHELAGHLEKQFLPGMSWKNIDKWEIDHIVPKSSLKYETYNCDGFKAAWSITNLQPLWTLDNRKKHAKLIYMI